MKPITAETAEGRILLALRAGEMTNGELAERLGHVGGITNLIRLHLVVSINGYYRITDKGRVACPYRNPLAAPGAVQSITFLPEIDMSKQTVVTRQQVLAVIMEAGPAGIRKNNLVGSFPMVQENAITSHLVMLKKDGSINNPSLGVWVATSTVTPKNEPITELPAVVASDNATAKQQLIDMPDKAFETIEIKAVPDRRAPTKIDVDADDLEIGIFSDGSMDLLVDDGLVDAQLKFTDAAVTKIRRFLGLFQEAA